MSRWPSRRGYTAAAVIASRAVRMVTGWKRRRRRSRVGAATSVPASSAIACPATAIRGTVPHEQPGSAAATVAAAAGAAP
ncbi:MULTISPECIES: hypothetical protein [unclassified Streptomyces]|uniref:hypothetical protein n=1 Tax=unclassified Streptomyces TaxID=2593676 RepID=UPI0022547A6F|nr:MULTISPECIES: hypothetical protein [unclassified Streptomyces]MCX5052047.1 hypothetical protein [Streptomyces sp. NBC_00474]MCX5062316.1 hypothetical protein [Streptomyces sp. NBC_00452]MCX5249942.1 hypothetical protein [Streptomyces sp. NBC_00201]